MRKKDLMEIRKRLKKDSCTFTRMCGCLVNQQKSILLTINECFLNLEDNSFFKYLEIAKKTLSGTLDNNLLNLDLSEEAKTDTGVQDKLIKLKKSALKDPQLINDFYNSIINNYDYEGNYLILLFHDCYDVITKTKDNAKLDESEEVYEYVLCSICPVTLSKPCLRYYEDEQKIAPRVRDWIVEPPINGFLYPAFTDRSSDIDTVLYYTKNAKDTHTEFMEGTLGCITKATATEQKETFQNIIENSIGDDEKTKNVLMDIQDNLNNLVNDYPESDDDKPTLSQQDIEEVLEQSNLPSEITSKITEKYNDQFKDTPPVIEHLIDKKTLEQNEQRKKEERLKKKVNELQSKLNDKENGTNTVQIVNDYEDNHIIAADEEENHSTDYDIVLKVKPHKMSEIKSELVEGKKCLVIPINENEQAEVNGSKIL